jgi:DNA-binding XRE family transcriptional regulator
MKEDKTFTLLVKHFNLYSRKFTVVAGSEIMAKQRVRELISVHPIDQRRGTYDGTHLILGAAQKCDLDFPLLPANAIDALNSQCAGKECVVPGERIVQIAFGSVMKRVREHLQIPRGELAAKVDLQLPAIGVLERGETGVRLFNFLKIAQALGKSPDDLLRLVVEEYERMDSSRQE